jgi:hypothetical protein
MNGTIHITWTHTYSDLRIKCGAAHTAFGQDVAKMSKGHCQAFHCMQSLSMGVPRREVNVFLHIQEYLTHVII